MAVLRTAVMYLILLTVGRLMGKRDSKVKRLLVDLEECNLSAAIQVEAEYIKLVK